MSYPGESPVRLSRRSFALAPAARLLAQSQAPLVLMAAESHGAHLGRLGTLGLLTPRLDALAEEGTHFTRCYANAPLTVSPEVSVRAGNPRDTYRALLDLLAKKPASLVVTMPAGLQFSNVRPPVDARDLRVPASWPNLAPARDAWAAYLNSVQCVDALVGAVLDALQRTGRDEETLVLYAGLAGPAAWRGRGTLYDLALHVPLIARGPSVPRNRPRHELISLSSLPQPTPVPLIMAAHEHARSVFDGRFHYLRNLQPGAAAMPPGDWRDARERYPLHWRLLTEPVPAEELYDHDADPAELHNLARDLAYSAERIRLAGIA